VTVTADVVRQLRERTGAGMMECKKALVETGGDLDAAGELMRKQGLAKADKKATRVAAEGVVVIAAAPDGRAAAMVEINCETDFVAREAEFQQFAASVAQAALAGGFNEVEPLLARSLAGGETVDERRRALIARIGENISVRRVAFLSSAGLLGGYTHGTRIGVLVATEGGDAALARDLAMQIAAANPRFLDGSDVPADELERERGIAVEQARLDPKNASKPEQVLVKIVDGKVRKVFDEQTLYKQPFIRDDKQSVEQLLKAANARALAFIRFEVGAGIEKKREDFAAEVQAQIDAQKKDGIDNPGRH